MPLSDTPWVSGSRPVRIDERDGWHTRLGVMQARKARAVARHLVEVRRLDLAALETVAVGALLVGRDEQDVGFVSCLCHTVNSIGGLSPCRDRRRSNNAWCGPF